VRLCAPARDAVLALPHPSPRNNGWLQRHPWFEAEWLPQVRARVAAVLAEDSSQIGL
jgi:uracil-DNA glycosylase